MPQEIITLPKQLANQIAAGEVVERPLSVVKELVENSLDAEATRIDIVLKEGGTKYIEVKDNGSGIPAKQLEKSLEKYSTSKITSLQDLYNVMTFGFRGEALASISSVSEFTLSSKTPEALGGTQVFTAGGDTVETSDVPHETGTRVVVEHLFFNTPARLSYLKKPRTEYLKILDFVQKISLAYENVAFSLTHDEKQVLQYGASMSIEERIYEIYGAEVQENIRAVNHTFDGIHISGYISDPKLSFSNKTKQALYVNKRVIQSPIIAKAISDAYNRFIPHGTHPAYILFIDIDPTVVDVNVHPRKMEVRFANEQSLFRSVYHGVKDELERVSLVSPHPNPLPEGEGIHTSQKQNAASFLPLGENGMRASGKIEKTEQYYTGSGTKFKNYSPYTNTQANPAQESIEFSRAVLGADNSLSAEDGGEQNFSRDLHDTPLGKIIGQVHNAYIVVQTEVGLQILDQHALAERVIYEKLAHSSYQPAMQGIIGGIGMHLGTLELENYENYSEVFSNMGFEIEALSGGNIMIYSIPDFISKQNVEKVFKNILADISEAGSTSLDEVRHKIWAYTACRSAIKFGDPLTLFEMNALLNDASLDYSATCPHGRPVVYDISLDELLEKYER